MATRLSEIIISNIAKIKNSKKIAATSDSVAPVERVRSIFSTMDIYLKLFGLRCEGCTFIRKPIRTAAKIASVISSLNSYIFFICVWVNQIRLIPILVHEGQYSPSMMVTLLLFFAYLTTTWGFTCWMVIINSHYQRIVNAIESVTSVDYFPCFLTHFNFSVNISLLMSFVFPMYSLVSLFKDNKTLMTEVRLSPGEHGTTLWEFMKYFYTYFAINAYGQFVCFSVFQAVICYLLQREFKDVAEKVNLLAKEQDENWGEGEIEKLRLRHKKICHATKAADKVVSYIVFGVYVNGILITCFCVSCLTHGSYPISELPTLFAVSLACLSQVVLTSVLGARLNHQAHRPHEILTRIKIQGLSRNDYRSMLVFLNQVSGSNIGITAIGMFTINKPAILTIVGTVITYAVIIQQLHVNMGADTGYQSNTTMSSYI